MKKAISLLLCIALVLPLFGCNPAEPGSSLSWQTAFRDSSLPAKELPADCIAFYEVAGDGSISITNVPQQEVLDYADSLTQLPRTRYFEQYLPENLLGLLPILDYAVAHNYCRMSIPTTEFGGEDIIANADNLRYMYRISGSGVGGLTVQSFDLPDGKTRNYVLVTLAGMDTRGMMPKYLEAIEEAKRIVREAPQGLSETELALYFYQYLTDNVRYADENYYSDGGWNLLYDTLITKRTVCAGYTEALYYLYNLAGIECFTIEGYIANPTDPLGNGHHIWNVAKLDGTYYQFDATWDEGLPPTQYRYFAVSTEDMQAYFERDVETAAGDYCPDCTASLLPTLCPEAFTDQKAFYFMTYLTICDWWYNDPAKSISMMPEDITIDQVTKTKDGIVLAIPYDLFVSELGYVMTLDAATQLCEGRFREDQELTRALYPQPDDYRCHRLTSFTENEDGSATATVALLDDGLKVVDTVTVTVTFFAQQGCYYIDSVEGLK